MNRLLKNMLWIGAMVILLMTCGKDVSAQYIDRQQITDTIKVDGEDKYQISYYDKAYYDDAMGKLYTEDLVVKCYEADSKGTYAWRMKFSPIDYDYMYTTSDWRYMDNTGGREVSYTIKGIGKYADLSYNVTYTFYPDSIEDKYEVELESDTTVEQPMLVYDGTEQKPVVYVKSLTGSKRLESQYYSISYENNINAGEGKVIIKGRDVYTGTLEYPFTIKRISITEYRARGYLAGENDKLTAGDFKEPEYTVNEIDKDRCVSEIILDDSSVGNYYFSVFSTILGKSVECTGVRIENYNEQWEYKYYPEGKLIDEDGSYHDICSEHTIKRITPSAEPTCYSEGHSSVYQCSMCGKYYSDEKATDEIYRINDTVIPKLEHIWGEWVECYPATSSYEGMMERHCSLCNSVDHKSIPKLPADSGTGNNPNTTYVPSVKKDTTNSESNYDNSDDEDSDQSNESDDGEYTVPKIAKISGYKITSKKKRQITLTWKKQSNIDGYEIQYSTDKKYKKAKIKKISKSKTSYTIKKLKSKKKYYVRIHAYKKYEDEDGEEGIAWGSWVSKNKKCK